MVYNWDEGWYILYCLVPGVCEQHPQEEGQRFHGGYQDQDQAHGKVLGRQRNYIKKACWREVSTPIVKMKLGRSNFYFFTSSRYTTPSQNAVHATE